MDAEQESNNTLEEIPANRKLVEELYLHGKITRETRKYALNILYPHNTWGFWTSRLLLIIGATLILAGVIYFFAFNWRKIPPLLKLSAIQIGILGSILGARFYSLRRMSGQVLLLCASVLIGVFMAVFGQIYQTGADAYQLFMMWSLLTLGWTLISTCAAQWLFWLIITNAFLILWWKQAALPTEEMELMIFTYMSLFNGGVLVLREYFAEWKACEWLKAGWARFILTLACVSIMVIPIIICIYDIERLTISMGLSGAIGIIGHGALYFCYRYILPDMRSLAITILSVCIIAETVFIKLLLENSSSAGSFLFLGLITLGIFMYGIIYLQKMEKIMEAKHV